MKAETFENLSQQAEALAARRPRLYQGLLVAMAIAGYAYVLIVLLVLLGLCGALVVMVWFTHHLNVLEIKLIVVLGILSWLLLRALWVRVSPPVGVVLRRAELPALFQMIDEIRQTVKAPPVKRVVLSPELNASVVQVPLLGLMGWHRNYLTIGLPLLHALSKEQFRAVLAHEFGHLSSAHGKLGVWMYRIHQTWGMVAAIFNEKKSVMRLVFMPITRGYLPRFSAFSLAQIRQHEYAADRSAREAAGVDATSTALIRLRVLGELEQEAWEPVYRQVNSEEVPPAPMSILQETFSAFHDLARAEAWLTRALAEKTEGGNTHPALCDRLAAICNMPVDRKVASAALAKIAFADGAEPAGVLLANRMNVLTAEVDRLWQSQIADAWKVRHEQVQQHRVTLTEMQVKAEQGQLQGEDEWMRALLTEDVEGLKAAFPLYRDFLQSHPSDLRAAYAVGRAMLDQGDPGGVPIILLAMEKASDLRAAGSHMLAQYYYKMGDLEASRKWRFSMENASVELAEMEAERATLTTSDKFLVHDLDPALIEGLRKRMVGTGEKLKAYLVRRKTRLCPDVPSYVLVIRRVVPWWKHEDSGANEQHERKVMEAVLKDLSFPVELRVFMLRRSSLLSRIAKVKNAEIYSA